MNNKIQPWKVTIGRGGGMLLAPADAAMAKVFGVKSARGAGLDGADCFLVQTSEDGKIAVLYVLATEGSGNPLLGNSFKQSPKRVGTGAGVSVVVCPNTNLSKKPLYTRYSGWLIPSREDQIHAWLILTEPDEMTQSQVSALSATAGPKSRPAHDLLGASERYPGI